MGAETNKPDERTTGKANKPGKRTDEPSASSVSAGTTGTGTAGDGRTGTGAAAGTGTSTGAAEKEQKPVELAVLEPPEPKPAPKKKPKKTRKTTAKQNDIIPAEQLDLLLVTLSGIVAARPGCEHWVITQSEAHSITEPLCKILTKYDVVSKIGENADAIALATAAITVILPRAIISFTQAKERERIERTGNRTETNVKVGEGTSTGTVLQQKDAGNAGVKPDHQNAISDLSDLAFTGFI